jgi:hypothetical protein
MVSPLQLHLLIVDGQISQCSNFVHLLGRPSWQGKAEVQAKNAEKAVALPFDKAKGLVFPAAMR